MEIDNFKFICRKKSVFNNNVLEFSINIPKQYPQNGNTAFYRARGSRSRYNLQTTTTPRTGPRDSDSSLSLSHHTPLRNYFIYTHIYTVYITTKRTRPCTWLGCMMLAYVAFDTTREERNALYATTKLNT